MRTPKQHRGTRWRLAVAMGAVALMAGCAGDARPGVLVTVALEVGTPRPTHLTLSWLRGDQVIFRDRRLPERGQLPVSVGQGITSVFVETTGVGVFDFGVDVRGLSAGEVICEGTGRVLGHAGDRLELVVTLTPGQRADANGDGIADLLQPALAGSGRSDVGLIAAGVSPLDARPVDMAATPPMLDAPSRDALSRDAPSVDLPASTRPIDMAAPAPGRDAGVDAPPPPDTAALPPVLFVVGALPLPATRTGRQRLLTAPYRGIGRETLSSARTANQR